MEQNFDKLFNYNRQESESFNYQNIIKNGSILKQFKLQEQEIQSDKSKTEINQNSNQDNLSVINLKNEETDVSLDRKKITISPLINSVIILLIYRFFGFNRIKYYTRLKCL